MPRWSGDISLVDASNKNILEYSVSSAKNKVYASSYLALLYYSLSPLSLCFKSRPVESVLFSLILLYCF